MEEIEGAHLPELDVDSIHVHHPRRPLDGRVDVDHTCADKAFSKFSPSQFISKKGRDVLFVNFSKDIIAELLLNGIKLGTCPNLELWYANRFITNPHLFGNRLG